MAYENLCMYCFEDLSGHSTCPHCGRDSHAAVPQIQMLPGTLVYHDRFLIGRALGQDATGIVYAAFDTKREKKLRIREYLPRDCAERLNDGTVVPVAGLEDRFDAGLKKLRASVEGEEDPRKRHFFFEENGTAYIAQRKSAAAESPAREERPEPDGRRRIAVIAIVAALVVIAAAAGLILFFNGALNGSKDVTENPTLDPNQVWIPAETPTPTPYASPTFAALVDPDLSWMDYTYEDNSGSGTQTVQGNTGSAATQKPTAMPTLSGDASGYTSVTTKSSQSDVRTLQQKLVTLGWLDYTQVTGKYDSATRQAVKDLQTYINQTYNPKPKLTVDGIAGPKTQQWLYQTDVTRPTATPKPTATPAPKVTAAPDESVINENSGANQIREMQRKLTMLGVLPAGSDSGRFDNTTRAAVRRFQARVNQLQGYEVLETSGTMDALSLAFLDYYVEEWQKLQTATAEPTATPTPAPTTAPTEAVPDTSGDIVNGKSSKDAIRAVQRQLIALGLLPAGSDDGVYGKATASAVSAFQQWVNQQRNEQTLPVNGDADALTRAFLQYCQDNNRIPNIETTGTPTQAPTDAPEIDDLPDENPQITIDANSPAASIRRVQEMLSEIGLLSESAVDGVYGSGTANAVRAFQEWANRNGGSLTVSGIVDNDTRLALEYFSDREIKVDTSTPTPEPTEAPTAVPTEVPTAVPTEAPTAVPTEAPTEVPVNDIPDENVNISVGPDSASESIRYVQEMLNAIGALPSSEITGVYGDSTVRAVTAFQRWVNSVRPNTLEVTGQIDNGTRQMLEYCYDHDYTMGGESPTEAPVDAEGDEDPFDGDGANVSELLADPFGGSTPVPVDDPFATPTEETSPSPEPTESPTPDPDNPFGEPDDDTDGNAVNTPFKATIDALNISVAGKVASGETIELSKGRFTIDWSATGAVESYYVYIADSAGNSIASSEATRQTSLKVDTSRMQAGEVYTITVGAKPQGGSEEEILWQTAKFLLPAPVTPEPTEVPTPTPEPTVAAIGAPVISIDGAVPNGEAIVIRSDSFDVSWTAGGEVASYSVQVADANGNVVTGTPATRQQSLQVKASQMRPGMLYTITIGALPVNGGDEDVVWSRAQFVLPEVVTPEPTPVPTPEPTPEPTEAPTPEPTEVPTPAPTVASVGQPFVTVGGSAYQQDGVSYMTDNTIIVSWGAEGEVAGYIVYVENQSGERQNLGNTTDTSRTVSAGSLPSGIYTIHVGAVPAGGTQEDAQWGTAVFGIPVPTPEPTVVPTPEPTAVPALKVPETFDVPIGPDSETGEIQRLQMRLYQLGLLPSNAEDGVLDRATLSAVAEFQNRANAQLDAGLSVIDPGNPDAVVDVATLKLMVQGLG